MKLLFLMVIMGGIFSVNNMQAQKRAKDMVIAGPNGIHMKLSHGILVPAYGDHARMYKTVEILRQGKSPVRIQLPPDNWADGEFIDNRSGPTQDEPGASSHKDWSLSLWSCDGHYIVLSTVSRWEDGTWNFRGSLQYAYDTTTGEYTEFDIPTALLGTDNFVQWSPTKCDVAILRGDHGNEEAKPTQ